MKEKIKGFIIGFFLMSSTLALAGNGWQANLKSAAVFDHYKEVIYLEPYIVEVCGEEQVVVGSQANVVNGALWGGIFGAIVGDAIDDKDGRVPGAIIGALIGAEEGQNQGTVTTTAMVCKQETRQQRTVRNVYSHSTIKFDYKGSYYEVDFTKR